MTTATVDPNKLRIALCQFNVGSVKEDNIKRASSAIDDAKAANVLVRNLKPYGKNINLTEIYS